MMKVHKSDVTSKPVREMYNRPEQDVKEQKKQQKNRSDKETASI